MHPEQFESSGISPSYGTIPNDEVNLSFLVLVRYLKKRCANVTEALI